MQITKSIYIIRVNMYCILERYLYTMTRIIIMIMMVIKLIIYLPKAGSLLLQCNIKMHLK